MGKHRTHTNLQPTDMLSQSIVATHALSERMYGREYLSVPLYLFTVFYLPDYFVCPAVHGCMLDVKTDLLTIFERCSSLMQAPPQELDESEGFTKIRREAINLAQDMGESYFDIGHILLAVMRETNIFGGIDKATIRKYKAHYCKRDIEHVNVMVPVNTKRGCEFIDCMLYLNSMARLKFSSREPIPIPDKWLLSPKQIGMGDDDLAKFIEMIP